jgi:hypothetical protein
LKSQRQAAFVKPKTVFTNDNLPARPRQEGLTAAAGMSSAEGKPAASGESPAATESAEAKPAAAGTATGDQSTEVKPGAVPAAVGPEVHDEKYYRTKMKELTAQRELHQRQLSVLQQKDSQNQMQFYTNPQKTLMQEFSRTDINKLTSEIDKKKAEIAADEDAMDALRDQLRRDGGDPGWLR